MLVPFQKETLSQARFIRDELCFNLLYMISGGELAVALQAEDGGAAALANPVRNMWLWVDPAMGPQYAGTVTGELAERLLETKLPGIVAAPENAELFSDAYCRLSGASAMPSFGLTAYACPEVKMPAGVPGRMERAGMERAVTAADFILGFNRDCFGADTAREEAMSAAMGKMGKGNLYLWTADGKAVCMAAVAHRAPRHARIGYVYTPPEERKKGYASALVARLSAIVLKEGLTPMLYADMKNPDSNKVYRSIGYMEAGAVEEIGFSY